MTSNLIRINVMTLYKRGKDQHVSVVAERLQWLCCIIGTFGRSFFNCEFDFCFKLHVLCLLLLLKFCKRKLAEFRMLFFVRLVGLAQNYWFFKNVCFPRPLELHLHSQHGVLELSRYFEAHLLNQKSF